MTKKTIGILLIILVMIISIGAISAADANETLQGQVSDTNIALADEVDDTNIAATSSDLKQVVNDTSPAIESVNDVDEISVDDSRNENHKVGDASSASNDVLSASDDDLIKHTSNNFLYNGKWYYDLDDAFDDADDEPGNKLIQVWGGTYKYTTDSDDFSITISSEVSITLQPYPGHTVIFDAEDKDWFFKVTNNNVRLTINDITFRNGNANEGNLEVEDGAQLTLNRCTFESNKAYANTIETLWGLSGAVHVDEGSLEANNCRFINNWAGRYGGAICVEDAGSVTLNNCYFEGNTKKYDPNKVANDFDEYDKDSDDAISWSFDNCQFKGNSEGSVTWELHPLTKSVDISVDVEEDVSHVVLYKDGVECYRTPCGKDDDVSFYNLERGTYTIYMIKGSSWTTEKRYEYKGTTFTILEPYFVLNDEKVFETLSAAVNAIPNGGTGEITVENGLTFTDSANFNVDIINKVVTIMPKDISDSADEVIFSGNSQNYLLYVSSNSKLTISGITITGSFSDSALKFITNQECTISDCEFKNMQHLVVPIFAQNSNLVLSGNTFESTSRIVLGNTVVNIDDCIFTSNVGINGGAIYANTESDVTITNSEFTANEGTGSGGAIYANKLNIHNTAFIGNSANLGGAVYIAGGSSDLVNITNCVFDLNSATSYRNIYTESLTRKFNLEFNEYDLDLKIYLKDRSYGSEYILDGNFDWGSNLNNTYTILTGFIDDETNIFGDMLTVVDNKFKINLGVLSGGTHEILMPGMYTQGDTNDHFIGRLYYSDLYGNEFYLNNTSYAKIGIEKGKILLTLEVNDVLIPETPVLNVYANWDLNYTVFIQNKYYQVEVVKGKGSMQLTGLDLGNYTVVAMRDADENFELAMNFTTFTIAKTYSNFLVLSTNVEYDTLNEAVANSNYEDTIYVKKGIYKDTGIVISNKVLDIIALEGAVFDAQGRDANFIIVNETAMVDISGITFRGLHNRNTNYGAIVNHGYLALTLCNFTDNKITKTSFAENGGAAIFSDGHSLDIDSCNFINNVAPLKVSTAAVTSLGHDEISITDSKFINNSAREGGALHFKNIIQFEPAITSCDFEKNTAVKGSSIYVGNNSGYMSVTLSDFKKNDIKNSLGENVQLEGGVIYANATSVVLDISFSNFEDNANSNVDGGVICLDGSSKASIDSCIFNNNSGKVGSAILIKNPNDKKLTLFIDSSAFTNNHAVTGAIATSPKVTTFIDECVFANNTGENRHIDSNGFTVVHDSIFEVKDAKLNAPSVQYGENSIITGSADIGTNIYAAANLTVAGENNIVEIKNNAFTYNAGILDHGKYSAVLNSIVDNNNNKYLMDSITEIFRVHRDSIEFNVSVDNITYGETLKVVESLPSTATGAIDYQLNGKYYTKEEIESLILDAGKYTLVAIYDHDDYAFTSTTVDFEVYKANPTISVPNVDVKYNDSIVLNIESDVASIYTIEIGDYKNVVFVNGSRTVVIDKTLNPGNYTIKVTSQERVNYISNSTEATLNVNGNLPVFGLRISNANLDDIGNDNAGEIDSTVDTSNKVQAKPLLAIRYFAVVDNEQLSNSPDNNLGEEYGEGKFLFQYDEDDDYTYFDTLEDAVDEAILYGAGIITVRGGTYSVSGMDIEGEVELTIRAYGDEKVIFDCGGEDYFMLLTYETEVEAMEAPPFFYTYQTEGPTVTLENITVINGVATYGGAIDLEAGTLTLTNCNFYSNTATEGGAIYIGQSDAENDAMLIALNTTFINNYAEDEGGAIYIASDNLDGQSTSASFMLCTFLENYQGEDEDRVRNYFAGGNADEITCQYCTFNANGEIYNFTMDKINQAVYVKGTSNDAFDSVVLLYFDTAPLYAINNNGSRDFSITFEDVMGGNYTVGVMNNHDFNTYIYDVKFEMKVPNFIISEDEVFENLTDAIDAVAENGIIYANMNYHIEEQMGIDINKSFTLKNFRDRDVVFDGNSTQWFFTIAEGCTVVFDGIYFTDGAANTHAAIENYGTLIINNCTFDSFETSAIIYNSGLLNILNSTFSLNFVNNAVVWNDADLVIDTVEFSYNIVNISSVVYTNGVAEIVASNFTGNFNLGNGGAIYNAKSLSIKDTVFTENEGYNGGAVYNEGTLEVINSTFEDNTANGYGGAIYNGNEADIFNSTFTGSSSELDGGAIYNNNIMAVDNSTFVGNTATGKGGAIYNDKSLELTKSLFGINFAEEFANIYNAGDIQFSENIFDFYDVILIIPDGEYGIPTTIAGTLDPQFNMDLQVVLPGFVNHNDALVTISEGVFEYTVDILPKGIYDVVLNEIIYDTYGNVYYGEAIFDRLIINKANVYINIAVDDIVLKNSLEAAPVLKISVSKDGLLRVLFNNKFSEVNVTGGQATITLDAIGEGNYSVFVVREGDENYNSAVNSTTFKVTEYEGNFIVNSTGNKFETLREALADSSNDDVIYVREGTYSGYNNVGLDIYGKKLSIISLGDVVFQANPYSYFLDVKKSADVTICGVVIVGFNSKNNIMFIYNDGNLTLDGCILTNNTAASRSIIHNFGDLTIVDSEFYDNTFNGSIIFSEPQSNLIVKESTFENNTFNGDEGFIELVKVNSVKIVSSVFTENNIYSHERSIIRAVECADVVISSAFYNNTQGGNDVIFVQANTNLLIDNSIFTGNTMDNIIRSYDNVQNTISGCVFTENTVKNVVLSEDTKLSVLESTFSDNTISDKSALNIASGVNAIVNGSVFTNNKGTGYRNIFSDSPVNISNSVFDALNVDFTVYDIDYGQTETIEGTIDVGTNLNMPINLNINSNTYSVNITDGRFTYNAGILNGGDYKVVLNPKDANSNTFVFDKITKVFTVSRIDPGLSVSIEDITQGEKLNVTTTIAKKAKGNVVYELNGNVYSKAQLENLTLTPGNYLVKAVYRGDKNYLPASEMVTVKVNKVAPNITVTDVVVSYGDEIKINVTVGAADYYTVFLDNRYNESVSLYVANSAIFTFPTENFNPGSYEIMVYVLESDDYAEAYAYATLTVDKAAGFFNLSNDLIIEGENATVSVEVPLNAYGNITYKVYDRDMNIVYNITQSCLEELVVPNLNGGRYIVTGTFEGDSYYTTSSRVNSGTIFVRGLVDVRVTVSNITYGENATVTVESNVDGDYLVHVGTESLLVTVINGIGNVSVPNLSAGSYAANVTVVDGNYAGFNETVFDVAPKSTSVAVSVEDIVFGENALVIVNGEIDGKYIVEIYGENYTVNVADGKGNTTIDGLAIGEDILVSVAIADGNYNATNTTTFNVFSKYNTPISLDIVTDENYVGMTVTVNDAATGLVKFQVTGQEEYVVYSDVINGVAVLEDILETGDYTVVATYMGNDRFNTNITYVDFIIKGHIKKNTTIDARADVNGNRVTLNVKVDKNATGFVEVKSGDSVSNIALENGEGTLTITLPYGSYSLDITYLGDENYNKNSTKCEFTLVEPEKEYTPISLDIVTDENYVGMTVTVSDAATGLVKFQVSGAEEYVVYSDVIDGKAILEDVLVVGDYNVIATYMGDSRFNTNITYGDFTITGHIKKDTPISARADVNGNRVTIIVTVDKNATGFVKLTVGGTVTNIEVEDGVAILTTMLVPNSYFVDVTYLGDDDFNMNSTKVTFTITEVAKKNTNIDLNIIAYEDSALIVVDLNKAATGLVKFYMVCKETGENYTMYMDIADGHVETFTNSIAPGNYSVTATYMGDSVFNTNTTSKDVEIIGHVMKDTPITANVAVNGNGVTLTAKVDKNATGFVELKFGDNVFNIALEDGIGTLTTSLPYGSYSLDITYLGDENYNKNSTKLEFTVVEPSKENTPISLDIVTEENNVTMTVIINDAATGLVKFQVTGAEEYVVYSDVINGNAVLEDVLLTGNYTVIATYMGDSRFNTNITYGDFTIRGHIKKDTPISARADVLGNRVTLTVNVDKNATGFVKLTVGSTVTNIEVVEGVATLTTILVPNSYYVDVTYLGDDDFNMNSTKVTFTITEVAKKNTNIDLNIIAYEDSALIVVDLNKAATGLVKFYMVCKETGENYTMYMDIADGHVETFTNSIAPGNYSVTATYMGDSVFNTNTTSKDVEIIGHIMKDTPIDANVETNETNVSLTVKVDVNATGFVEVKFGDNVFNIALENGEGILKTTLPYGSYNLNITYLGDYNYNINNTELTFNVTHASKAKPDVETDIINKTGSTPSLNMNLPKDATGKVFVYVNDIMSQIVDVVDGSAIIVVPNLIIGDNNVSLVYSGDDNYDPVNQSFVLNRNATVIAYNMTRGYNSGLDYTAKLLDDEGFPLSNMNITIKVGTNLYVVQTDSEGVFKFNNRLAVGDYPVVIYNPVTGEYKLTNLKIVKRITENKDVTIFFADGSNYKVRITGDDGNYVGAGETVSINVGGKTYSVKTDKNGYANLKLTLKVKKHTITVTYKGFTTKNKVTVKSVVKPVKKTVKVKKTAKKLKIKVKLKGKKVLKKKRVYLKFKGKTYKAKTNKKGIATFKVPKKVIKKLKKGKKYKAVFTYKAKANGKTIKNTAKCYVKVRK